MPNLVAAFSGWHHRRCGRLCRSSRNPEGEGSVQDLHHGYTWPAVCRRTATVRGVCYRWGTIMCEWQRYLYHLHHPHGLIAEVNTQMCLKNMCQMFFNAKQSWCVTGFSKQTVNLFWFIINQSPLSVYRLWIRTAFLLRNEQHNLLQNIILFTMVCPCLQDLLCFAFIKLVCVSEMWYTRNHVSMWKKWHHSKHITNFNSI